MATKKLSEVFNKYAARIAGYAKKTQPITPETVFREGVTEIRVLLNELIGETIDTGSCFRNTEHIEDFLAQIEAGKKGIILPEHYSNLDYPLFLYLLANSGEAGKKLAERCVAIAGMKLTEDDPSLALLTQGYTRINIYPSRTLASITDPNQLEVENKRSRAINLASMRVLDKVREDGQAIVVFPAGTRYRPGKPETKRGLREIDSYIKSFDIMLLVSINGNCLRLSDNPSDMMNDQLVQDRIIMDASPVTTTKDFREAAAEFYADHTDKKQAVVDFVMYRLEHMHTANEKTRFNS